jgi:hypothetical protein
MKTEKNEKIYGSINFVFYDDGIDASGGMGLRCETNITDNSSHTQAQAIHALADVLEKSFPAVIRAISNKAHLQ